MRVPLILSVGSLFLLSCSAQAWWDTRLEVTRLALPPDQEFSVTQIAGAALEDDPQIDGGRGGRAHWLAKDGPAISQKVTLQPGLYSWSAICRGREPVFSTPLFGLTLSKDGKEVGRWFLPGRVSGFYGVIPFYFPIETAGEYTISFHLEGNPERLLEQGTKEQPNGEPLVRFEEKTVGVPAILQSIQNTTGVLIDRFELASLLPSAPLKQKKTKRNLSDDEIFGFLNVKPEVRTQAAKPMRIPDLDTLWGTMPDYNVMTTNGRDGYSRKALVAATTNYLQTKDEKVGVYTALLLCGLSEKWPAADYNATYIGTEHTFLAKEALGYWGTPSAQTIGKALYRGWAHMGTLEMLVTYDALFDILTTNQDFLDRIRKVIPSLKTHDDVISFLDVRLLWASARDYKRCWISRDNVPPLIAQVFGPGPEADEILRTTVFDRIQTNMVHLGSIDDNAVTTFDRDGIRYVGSSLYSDRTLVEVAGSLSGYRKLGGGAQFDFLSYPEGRAAHLNLYSLAAMRMAGGFRATTGDGGGLHQVIEPGFETLPSRVLGGSGYTVLESGQFDGNPLKARAVGIYWGSGRGHAHSDTLNIELFAHSSRMAPDLGGRQEGRFFGRPNMRLNRVHNLVEIDDKDFWNPALSITSASGWLVSFAPASKGSQFTEHRASALSHPEISLYQRQTALISVPGETREESYLFDVFRVRGGKTHSYNFHGAVTDSFRINSELKPAEEHPVLKDHRAGSRQEGVAAAVLEAEWPMTEAMQKKYQEKNFEEGRQPVTRLMLFGQEGASVLVGNAYSEYYKYDFPFLYVRKEGKAQAQESCFPALIEMVAGKPFLKSAKLLTPVSEDAQAPVALEVETVSGRQDLLYSSGKPETAARFGDGEKAEISGRFGFVARNGKQLEEARLVGGARLRTPEIAISIPEARIVRKVASVDYARRLVTLDKPLPTSFQGATVTINNGSRFHAFNLEAVQGKEVTLKEYPGFYKSNLVHLSEDGKTVIGELETEQSRWDAGFAKNTVLTNEDQSRTVRVEAFEDDVQWMTMGYPGYRWSFPLTVEETDFPDANGDGRRMARLEADPHTPKTQPAAPGEIEILRIVGDRIYFRVPNSGSGDSDLNKGGWNLNGFILVPEGGAKRFYSRYSGKHMRWKLQNPLTRADLTDPNGDGKTKLYAFVFAAGDALEADATIQIRRDESGKGYRILTNTPATIGFPKDGFKPTMAQFKQSSTPVKLHSKEGYMMLELTAEMVAAGEIVLTER